MWTVCDRVRPPLAHVRKRFFDSRVVPVVPVTEDGDTADRWKEGFMVRLSADIIPAREDLVQFTRRSRRIRHQK